MGITLQYSIQSRRPGHTVASLEKTLGNLGTYQWLPKNKFPIRLIGIIGWKV
jgi:hypothetical protein